jgi:AraC-like DNA-binding protein
VTDVKKLYYYYRKGEYMNSLEVLDSLTDYTEINIKGCGDIEHDKNWIEHENKVDYDLWVVLEGELQIEMAGKKYFVKDNDAFFLCPETIYKANSITKGCKFIYMHFDFKIGNNVKALEDFSLSGPIYSNSIQDEVKAYIKSYSLYKKKEMLSFLTLKGYFTALISKIIVLQYEKNKLSDQQKQNIAKPLSKLQPVLIYISEHINELIYTKDLAEILGFSEKYFITFFKETIGTTPNKYIRQLKMNKALNYIYEKKYSLKEISYILGYPDQYTFSKAFKKQYGVAPSMIIQEG